MSYTRDVQTSGLQSVQRRLRELSGAELVAIAKTAGVGRSTVYRLRNLPNGEAITARDATVARIEAALATRGS